MNRELVELRAENSRLTVGLAALSANAKSPGAADPGGSQAASRTATQIAELQRAVLQLQNAVAPYLPR